MSTKINMFILLDGRFLRIEMAMMSQGLEADIMSSTVVGLRFILDLLGNDLVGGGLT